MKREFVVTDETGQISYSGEKDDPESFHTWKAAKARSEELAKSSPGCTIKIYELTAETIVPLKPVETARKHPIEHYTEAKP